MRRRSRLPLALLRRHRRVAARARTGRRTSTAASTVTILVGFTAGGGYDLYARLLGRHIGQHIPGNPTVVVQNMPGAGSMKAAQYVYGVAAKDGLTLATVSRGMVTEPLLNGANFDPRQAHLARHHHQRDVASAPPGRPRR